MRPAQLELVLQQVRSLTANILRFAEGLAGAGPESHAELALSVTSIVDSRIRAIERMPAGAQQDAAVVRLVAAMREGDAAGRAARDFTKALRSFQSELARLEEG